MSTKLEVLRLKECNDRLYVRFKLPGIDLEERITLQRWPGTTMVCYPGWEEMDKTLQFEILEEMQKAIWCYRRNRKE
jgi:hypothetical protein